MKPILAKEEHIPRLRFVNVDSIWFWWRLWRDYKPYSRESVQIIRSCSSCNESFIFLSNEYCNYNSLPRVTSGGKKIHVFEPENCTDMLDVIELAWRGVVNVSSLKLEMKACSKTILSMLNPGRSSWSKRKPMEAESSSFANEAYHWLESFFNISFVCVLFACSSMQLMHRMLSGWSHLSRGSKARAYVSESIPVTSTLNFWPSLTR